MPPERLTVRTPTLEIAYEARGPPTAFAVILLHGFPDDVRAFDDVAPPWPPRATACWSLCAGMALRGFSTEPRPAWPSRPPSARTSSISSPRSICARRAGGVRLGWPGRVHRRHPRARRACGRWSPSAATTCRTRSAPPRPAHADQERANWYQWYFNTERGRRGPGEESPRDLPAALGGLVAGLALRRGDLRAHRRSFDNPDFVDIVDPLVPPSPRQCARRSALRRGRAPAGRAAAHQRPHRDPPRGRGHRGSAAAHRGGTSSIFPPGTERRVVEGAGHFMPRERPDAVVDALRALLRR